MEKGIKFYVGLDVHKDTIAIAVAEAGRTAGRVIGTLAHDVNKLLKALGKLGRPEDVHVVYEAGPTGYGLQRTLAAKGYRCEVIAPSLIPKRAGERIKTDRRDCLHLAQCSRSGDLRAVWIPDPEDESIRDLARAREDAVHSRTQARHQLKGFLLRHGVRYAGKTSWSKTSLSVAGDAELPAQRGADGVHRVLASGASGRQAGRAADAGAAGGDRNLAFPAGGGGAAGIARPGSGECHRIGG
jgi:transposase